jgi:hypothetical protein
MSFTIAESIVLTTLHCYKCGVLFAMPKSLDETCTRDKQEFFCPNGHGQYYTESLRDKIAKLQVEVTQAKGEAMRERQQREHVEIAKKRLENRVKRGVCPCCHRYIKQLANHMKTKHPDYASK